MTKRDALTPMQWLGYWQQVTDRETKAAMKYIRRHASDKGSLDELMKTLTPSQRQVIQRGMDLLEHSTRLMLLAEMSQAFDTAIDDADNGVQPGEKPRIVK